VNLGTAEVIRADARNIPLEDDSVDLVVTSPPYFALRSYQDGGEHYDGQIGSEPTPAEFVAALLDVTRECVRVLKPSGSLWVNLGDTYSRAGGGGAGSSDGTTGRGPRPSRAAGTIPTKSLSGIPWRYALACIDDLGLILRAEVIWSKPNGLPESVTDRVRRSHEQWFHMVLNPRYFSAVDEIREAHATPLHRPGNLAGSAKATGPQDRGGHSQWEEASQARTWGSSLGKLPGSVWTVPTEPLRVPDHLGIDHFAAFPTEWPRRIIQGWSPSAVCADCGFLLGSTYDSGMLGVRREFRASHSQRRARRSVLLEDVLEPSHLAESEVDEVSAPDDSRLRRGLEAGSPDGSEVRLPDGAQARHGRASGTASRAERGRPPQERGQDGQPDRESGTPREDRARPAAEAGAQAIRLPSLRRHDSDVRDALACPHCGGTSLDRPVVADIFGGTGTTAMVAKALGRHGISVDMSADYCRLAEWRTNDRDQLAKVLGIAKAEQQPVEQLDLFGGVA
jgi:DNA modification methylase